MPTKTRKNLLLDIHSRKEKAIRQREQMYAKKSAMPLGVESQPDWVRSGQITKKENSLRQQVVVNITDGRVVTRKTIKTSMKSDGAFEKRAIKEVILSANGKTLSHNTTRHAHVVTKQSQR